MARYLLIESRDPYTGGNAVGHTELAALLKLRGHEVALLLVQNAVLPVRAGAHAPSLRSAIAAGVEVLADEFALQERGIAPASIAHGVHPAPLSSAVERLADGWTTIWR